MLLLLLLLLPDRGLSRLFVLARYTALGFSGSCAVAAAWAAGASAADVVWANVTLPQRAGVASAEDACVLQVMRDIETLTESYPFEVPS